MSDRSNRLLLLRSHRAFPSLLGVVALSILSATPPVGAAGGDIDNDSPYNMPTVGDSSDGSGSSGGGIKSLTNQRPHPDGRHAGGAIAPLVPNVQVGGTFSLVEKLEPGAYVSIPGTKVAVPSGTTSPGAVSSIQLTVPTGEQVVARDSAPLFGDSTVEIQGSFVVQGVTELPVFPNKQFMMASGFVLLGTASESATGAPTNANGLLSQIEHVLPIAASGKSIDVAAIAAALAKEPALTGMDAQVIVGHKSWAPGMGFGFHVDATVDFEVSKRPIYRIDTTPPLD